MNEHVTRGFLKEAGFFGNMLGKVKSFFGGGGGGSVGAQTVRLGSKARPVPKPPAHFAHPSLGGAPKMQMLSGSSSIKTPVRPRSPSELAKMDANRKIRSEIRHGLGTS